MGRKEGRTKLPPGVSIDRLEDVTLYATVGGRPLDEVDADETVREGVEIELPPNNHNDSRKNFPGLTMNRSAMQSVSRNTEAVYDGLAWLYANYLNHYGQTQPGVVTAREADEMAMVGMWMPSYLVLRGRKPVTPTRLPETVGELYKVTQGIHDAAGVIREMHGDNHPVTAQTLYQTADTLLPDGSSLFVSTDGRRVCPARQRAIENTTARLLTISEGNAARSELNHFVRSSEFPRIRDFSLVTMDYIGEFLVFTHRLEQLSGEGRGQDMSELHKRFGIRREGLQRRFNQALGRDPVRIGRS